MARRVISQDEAHRLAKRVTELEDILDTQKDAFIRDFPEGVYIATIEGVGDGVRCCVMTARKLGHAVVVTNKYNDKDLNLYALPLPRVAAE
jgi:hypothetical protein